MRRVRNNPSAAATLGWAIGGAVVTSGVVYFVLREIYTKQVLQACFGNIIGGTQVPGALPSTIDPAALERRVRQML